MHILMLGLIVAATSYLLITLVVAHAAVAVWPVLSKLAAALAPLLPGTNGWYMLFDLRGQVGSVSSMSIAAAVLLIPFCAAGFGLWSHIANRREQAEQRRDNAKTARQEQVRLREQERDRMRKQGARRP